MTTRDAPRTWRELWRRSGPVERRRLLGILARAALLLVALVPVAVVIALLL